MAASLLDLLLAKGAELAGRAVAKGVDYLGRKLAGDEPPGQPVPFKNIELRRKQEEAAISHKVPPK